jgi:signal transduction histidine kinase
MEQSGFFQPGTRTGMTTVTALAEAVICGVNLNQEMSSMVAKTVESPEIRGVLLPDAAEHAALVIVDLDQEGGADAARKIRDQNALVPILLLAQDLNSARELAALGRVDFLGKPLFPEILAARLENLIRPERRSSAPIASIVTDEEGDILSMNHAAEELFGTPQNLRDVIPAWQPSQSDRQVTARSKEGSEFHVQVISTPRQEGGRRVYSTFVLDHSSGQTVDPEGLEGVFSKCLDDLKHKRMRLKQFANAIGHDFQEPLRMVVSYTQLVEQRYGPQLDGQAQPLMEFAVQGAKRINALLRALSECMELESAEYDSGEVDCGEALDRAVEDLDDTIRQSRAVIERGELPKVKGDAKKLAEVFRRLIDNAIKFNSSAAPVIRVSADQRADGWTISLEDNGIGIEADQMERAFTIFKRLHGSKYPGAGIGLTMCSMIVERHGGRIWADSTPGEGSTFYFTIPVDAA